MIEAALSRMMTARALGYLTVHSAKNRVLSRVRRAKNPRYAFALLLGAFYLWGVYIRPLSSSSSSSARSGMPGTAVSGPAWTIIGTAFLLVMTLIAWFFPSGTSNLALDKAESAFIIPGPVSSRGLIGYKLLRAQMAVLMTALIWTVLLRRGSSPLAIPFRVIAVWMFFTTMNLHRTGAAIVRAAWSIRGGGAMRKHSIPTIVVVVAIIGLAISVGLNYNEVLAAWQEGFKSGMSAVATAMTTGPAAVVLWPIRAVLGPMVAKTSAEWYSALPAAIIMFALHLVWVFRSDDEAVAAAVTRATERMQVMRDRMGQSKTGRMRVRSKPDTVLKTMRLAPTGWPATAIVWKNVLCMRRKTRSAWITILALASMPLLWAVFALIEGQGIALGVAIFALGTAAILLIFGPMLLRNDLRDDMLNLTALKLLPLTGRTIVAAEVLSVVAPLGLVQCALVLVSAIAMLFTKAPLFGPGQTVAVLLGGLPAVLVFTAAVVSIQNAAPVLFPAWTKLGAITSGGMEAMGQVMIVVGLFIILLFLMLLVPGGIATGIVVVGRHHLATALLAGLAIGAFVLGLEVAALVAMLGRALERTEPSDVPT